MPPRVVFDANVLFSAISWRGRPYQCVNLARTGITTGLTCAELLDERADKLRTKLMLSDEQIADTLADLLSCLTVVVISNTLHGISTDPDDDKVLECAATGGAAYIVSGDRRRHNLQTLPNSRAIVIALSVLSMVHSK